MAERENVLEAIIKLLKNKDIIDPHLNDTKIIEKLKFSEMEYFKHALANDQDVKYEDFFQDLMVALGPLFTPDQKPTTSPDDYTVLKDGESIGELADNILMHT